MHLYLLFMNTIYTYIIYLVFTIVFTFVYVFLTDLLPPSKVPKLTMKYMLLSSH